MAILAQGRGEGLTPSPPRAAGATDDAFARGVARAEAATADATTPPPIDAHWCRFGAGLECLNGDRCLNPNHRGPQAPGTTTALANAAVHNRRRRAAKGE